MDNIPAQSNSSSFTTKQQENERRKDLQRQNHGAIESHKLNPHQEQLLLCQELEQPEEDLLPLHSCKQRHRLQSVGHRGGRWLPD